MATDLGSRTTATQVLRDADLSGKTAIVTGGNSGIGVETVRALAHAGAKVVFTSRNIAAGEAVLASLRQDRVTGSLQVQQLDLADLSSVITFANNLQAEPKIDMLILNAGVAGTPETYTQDNFELTVGTNHFGHFVLVELLLGKLRQQATPVRIVAVSSEVHRYAGFDVNDLHFRRRPYSKSAAYHQSKLCNVLFIKELAIRLQESNVEVFALNPGFIATGLSRHLPFYMRWAMKYIGYFFSKSIEQGAATSVYAATAPALVGKSGAYLSDCNIAKPSAQAEDAELAKVLWKVTEQQLQDPSART